jgi:hypothetical protein
MELVAQAAGNDASPAHPAVTAMIVHLPDGSSVPRRAGDIRREDMRGEFGQPGVEFLRWQERAAEALWNLALSPPPWPRQSLSDLGQAAAAGIPWLIRHPFPGLEAESDRSVEAHLDSAPEGLRLFVDAQLLILAQGSQPRPPASTPTRGMAQPHSTCPGGGGAFGVRNRGDLGYPG